MSRTTACLTMIPTRGRETARMLPYPEAASGADPDTGKNLSRSNRQAQDHSDLYTMHNMA